MRRESEKLYDSITDIRDEHIDSAREYIFRKHKSSRRKWQTAAIAAVAVIAIAVGVVFQPWGSPSDPPNQNPTGGSNSGPDGTPSGNIVVPLAYTIARAEYPETAPYPTDIDHGEAYRVWSEGRQDRWAKRDSSDGLESFFAATASQFLSDAEGSNVAYSPLNVYLALGMLAELSGGNTRQQILDLLGSGSIEDLRAQAHDVWLANYIDDGAVSSILASSLWLDENVAFNQSAMDILAESYYASSYQGKMGDPAFDQALRDWLNDQTGGLLEEQQIKMDAQTVLALATTICFQGKWADEFSPGKTTQGVFHAASGDMTCDFMHESRDDTYFWGDGFSAVRKNMNHAGTMFFILPDEGVSVDALLADGRVMEFLLGGYRRGNSKQLIVNLSVPKFDVTSQLDLVEDLKALGVTDVFSAEADFTPMTAALEGPIYAAEVRHDVRITIDEEGCTAAAYTVIPAVNQGIPPDDEIDFVMDRPFLIAIMSDVGDPLFLGVVNRPVP